MRRFISKVAFFLISCIIVSSCLFVTWFLWYRDSIDFPAPNLSNSYSFNEKADFLRNKLYNVEVLAIGSSISLNNLHSQAISQAFNTNRYINSASWGLNLEESYETFKILCKQSKPKTVIIASNVCDFYLNDKIIRFSAFERYIQSNNLLKVLCYLRTIDFPYLWENAYFSKVVRTSSKDYYYLKFDDFGGVNLTSKDFNFDEARWLDSSFIRENLVDSIQYRYLDSLSLYCKQGNIDLLFFQSPIREGKWMSLNQREINLMNAHTDRVSNHLNRYGFKFVNSNKTIWPDSLFADWLHLNDIGANQFTESCLREISHEP